MFNVFGRASCSFCTRAQTLLKSQGQPYVFYDLNTEEGSKLYQNQYRSMVPSTHTTVPVIFFYKQFVGGYDDLERLLNQKVIF